MSATKKGHDMTMETFKSALDQANDYGYECITLGGGETTLHPEFEKMLFLAIVTVDDVFIITNGSQTDMALALAKLAKRGVIGAELSQDEWHDDIDPYVVEAFTKDPGKKFDTDRRGIRRSLGPIARRGRAARKSFMAEYETSDRCSCEGNPFVDPLGQVHQCGCYNSPVVGDVVNGFDPLDNDDYGDTWQCYKEVRKMQLQRSCNLVPLNT
jgi:MoaA/NifB/PqqE/SkfB family radical SAM enzyme